jgi:hypothetical protein
MEGRYNVKDHVRIALAPEKKIRKFNLISSHPETTFPDENIQLPAILYSQKPFEKGFLARASFRNPGVSIRKFEFPDGN